MKWRTSTTDLPSNQTLLTCYDLSADVYYFRGLFMKYSLNFLADYQSTAFVS